MIPPKRFDIFSPLIGGCSADLDAFIFFFNTGALVWIDTSREMHMVSTKWRESILIRQERQIVWKGRGAYYAVQAQTGDKNK